MLKPWPRYFLYIFTLPIDLLGWLLMIFVGLVWGTGWPHWIDGALIATLRNDSWPGRTWYKDWGGTTFGHAIMIREGQEHVLAHEMVHVLQFESVALIAFIITGLQLVAFRNPWTLVVWVLLPILNYVCAMLIALFHGEDAYRHNILEEAAYDHAQVEDEKNHSS